MSKAASIDSCTVSMRCSILSERKRVPKPSAASDAAWPTGLHSASLPGRTRARPCAILSANLRSPAPSTDIAPAIPSPYAMDFAIDAWDSSGGRLASACAARRTRQMFAAARTAAAGATIAYDRPRLAPLRSNVSCSAPTTAPAVPLVASMYPLVRAPARGSGSRWCCGSAFCNTRPAPIAARSAAIDVVPQRPSWTRRRRACPPATSAAAWIDSWTRLTNAWFAAAERPVTSA